MVAQVDFNSQGAVLDISMTIALLARRHGLDAFITVNEAETRKPLDVHRRVARSALTLR